MKNIRILEDGNRLIVVLEGYEKSALNALIETIGTVSTPLSHIKPHTGEDEFRLNGTEKEVFTSNQPKAQEQEAGTVIKRPAFMEQIQSGKAAGTGTKPNEIAKPVKETAAAKEEKTEKAEEPEKQASHTAAAKMEEPSIPPEIPEPQEEAEAPEIPETPEPAQTTGTVEDAEPAKVKAPTKPAEFMNSFELRACIQQADKGKLSTLLRRKGRFPNIACLLNADDRTLREYVKELLLVA